MAATPPAPDVADLANSVLLYYNCAPTVCVALSATVILWCADCCQGSAATWLSDVTDLAGCKVCLGNTSDKAFSSVLVPACSWGPYCNV